MLRAVVNGKRHLECIEVAKPEPGPGEMVIEVKCALTCGSDKVAWINGNATPIGREFSGIVHSVGKGVEEFQVGQAVMTTYSASCHECSACARQHESYCDKFSVNAAEHGFSQYVKLAADVVKYHTFPKPDSMSFACAAFLEPLALTVHTLVQPVIKTEDTVVILGSGALGLLQLITLRKLYNPAQIILVSNEPLHLDLAQKLGATHVINAHGDNLRQIVRLYTDDYGAQLIIDNAGVPESWDSMLSLASKAATILTCGGCPSDYNLSVDATCLHYDQITFLGSCNYNRVDVLKAFDLLVSGQINPMPLITASLPIQDLDSAFSKLANGEGVKFAIDPNQ